MTLTEHQFDNRRQWVKDLLSGDFNQGRDAFKRDRGGVISYCCLGVACQRVAPASPSLEIKYDNGISEGVAMPKSVIVNEFGMVGADQSAAMKWNDSYSFSFSRIADFIAYATFSGLEFSDIVVDDIPEGYAAVWLKLSELS